MEKTYSPTAKKRKRARKDGDIAKSNELTGLVTTAYGLCMLGLTILFSQQFLTNPHNFLNYTKGIEIDIRMNVLLVFAVCVLVFSLLFVSVVVEMLQVGFSFNLGLVKPKVSRVNPFSGFKKIIGIPEENVSWSIFQSPLFEAIKCSCYSLGALICLMFFRNEILQAVYLSEPTTSNLLSLGFISIAPIVCVCLTLSLMSLWVARKLQHVRLKMDREELKRELRDSEGREEQKQRRHEAYLELGRRIENASVRRAKFVIKRD